MFLVKKKPRVWRLHKMSDYPHIQNPIVISEPVQTELEIFRSIIVDDYIDNWGSLFFIMMCTSFTSGYFLARLVDALSK